MLTCEGTVIPSQDEMELLGVTIDNKLKFERQIRKISRKVSQPSVEEISIYTSSSKGKEVINSIPTEDRAEDIKNLDLCQESASTE